MSQRGIATNPDKIRVVQNWEVPTNVTELRSFLGFCSYYRRFVANFALIAKPLHDSTKKGMKFASNSKCHEAFNFLRKELSTTPVLTHPDFSTRFILDTDASNFSIGAVLSQDKMA